MGAPDIVGSLLTRFPHQVSATDLENKLTAATSDLEAALSKQFTREVQAVTRDSYRVRSPRACAPCRLRGRPTDCAWRVAGVGDDLEPQGLQIRSAACSGGQGQQRCAWVCWRVVASHAALTVCRGADEMKRLLADKADASAVTEVARKKANKSEVKEVREKSLLAARGSLVVVTRSGNIAACLNRPSAATQQQALARAGAASSCAWKLRWLPRQTRRSSSHSSR